MKPILLGTHLYPADGDAADRMNRAIDEWARLSNVQLINLQFASDPTPIVHSAFETRAVLRHDSRSVTGVAGTRKPIVRELLDALTDAASRAGCDWAGFSNADILISQAAIDRVTNSENDAIIFSRMDIDPTTYSPLGEFFSGQDTLFIRPKVYRMHRHRFRPYIIGEMPWDVIYTSILLTHTRAELVNRGDDCRHVLHDTIWVDSPFAPHAWRLAHMDWTYFSRWYQYYEGAKAIRAQALSAAAEDKLRSEVFSRPFSLGERMKCLYRRMRYGRLCSAGYA